MTGRGIVAVGVLAAWGAGLAVFAQREMSRSATQRLAEAAVRVSPGASYFAMHDGARHVGFSSFTTDTVPNGLQFTEYTVRDGHSTGRQVRQVVTSASRALVVRDVVVSAGAPVARAIVTDDSTLLVLRDGPESSDTIRHHFSGPLLLPSLVPMAVALGEAPEVGDRHAWDVFDPATLGVRRLSITLRAESTWVVMDSAAFDSVSRRWLGAHADTVQAWHVVEDGGSGVDAWVDEQGHVVASRAAPSLVMRRAAYELAFENWRSAGRTGGDAGDSGTALAGVTTVRPSGRTRALTLVVRGLPFRKLAATSEWQVLSGDTLRVTAPDTSGAPNGYWLPPHRDFRAEHARVLQVEPGIEVDAPFIVSTSRRVRDRQPDPLTFARTLARWVSDSIRLEPTLTPMSALSTLRSGSGDADHHTLAFVTLARASGMPARTVRGLLRAGDQWLSHSWAEVFVGAQWLPVDPTTGQVPADAAHVRLVIGSVSLAPELDRLTSRATITVLSSSSSTTPSASSPRP